MSDMDHFEETLMMNTLSDDDFAGAVAEIGLEIAIAAKKLDNDGRHKVVAELIAIRDRLTGDDGA